MVCRNSSASACVSCARIPRTTQATGKPLREGCSCRIVLTQTPIDRLFRPFAPMSPGQVTTSDSSSDSGCLTWRTVGWWWYQPGMSRFWATWDGHPSCASRPMLVQRFRTIAPAWAHISSGRLKARIVGKSTPDPSAIPRISSSNPGVHRSIAGMNSVSFKNSSMSSSGSWS